MKSNLPASYATLEEYVTDTVDKLRRKDPTTTKLQIDDFHYPDVDLEGDEYFDSPTIAKLLFEAKHSPYVKELELRFVEIDRAVSHALIQLLLSRQQPKQQQENEISFIQAINIGEIDERKMEPFKLYSDFSFASSTLPSGLASEAKTTGLVTSEDGNSTIHSAAHQSHSLKPREWDSISIIGCTGGGIALSEVFLALAKTDHSCKRLMLNHNNLQYQGFSTLGRLLQSTKTIQTLHLKRDVLQGENADAVILKGLQYNTTIEELIFNFCRFDDVGVQALATCFRYHQSHGKEPSETLLSFTTPRQFAGASNTSIKPSCQIRVLDMGACYLADSQVETLVSALVDHPTLHTLILTLNSCHDRGSAAMERLLGSKECQLVALNLSHQKDIHDRRRRSPAQSSRLRQQQEQHPVTTTEQHHIPDENRDQTHPHQQAQHHDDDPQLQQSQHFVPKVNVHCLANVLKTNTTLVSLKLSRNRLKSSDIIPLIHALSSKYSPNTYNFTLEVLDLNNNSIDDEGMYEVASALPTMQGLRKLYLLNNDIVGRRPPPSIHSVPPPRYSSSRSSFRVPVPDTDTNEGNIGGVASSPSTASASTYMHAHSPPLASLALLEAVKVNVILQVLELKYTLPGYYDIQYYVALNRGGRQLFTTDRRVPLALWPIVFARLFTISWQSDYVAAAAAAVANASANNSGTARTNLVTPAGTVPTSPMTSPPNTTGNGTNLSNDILFQFLKGPVLLHRR